MWRDRCDACFAFSRYERSWLTAVPANIDAARRVNQPENRSSAASGCRAKSERPSGRRRSRAGGRLRVSPLTRSRATLKLIWCPGRSAANFVPDPGRTAVLVPGSRPTVRSVTLTVSQHIESANETYDATAKLHHSVGRRALFTR